MEDPPSYEAAMAAEQDSHTPYERNVSSTDEHESKTRSSPNSPVPPNASSFLHVPSEVPSAPPVHPSPHSPPMPQAMQLNFGILTDETIRKAFYDYAERNFKNGSSVIEHMSFFAIRSFYSLHYKLETFFETRECVVRSEKCGEKAIDGSNNGPEPNIRNIFVVCKQKFWNGEEHVVIPHSEHLRACRKCDDRGKEDCLVCKGAGWNHCSPCNGHGYLKDRSACSTCNRSGRLICDPCYSSGRINCSVCDGHKKVRSYKEVKVTWTNHVDEFDVNPADIPTNLLKSSTGSEIFSEESPRVQPLTQFPDASINIASLNLIFKHQKDCANKVVLLQRHSIRAIPISKMSYCYTGKTGDFYVYGMENNVYFENFPELLDFTS